MSIERYTGPLTITTAGRQFVPAHSDVSVVDLSYTSFIDAFALVLVALDVANSTDLGIEVEVVEPETEGVANYLSRMHLNRLLDSDGIVHRLPSVRESRHAGFLIPLTEIAGQQFTDLADLVANRMHIVESVDVEVASSVSEAIYELGANTQEHSRADRAFFAAQVYKRNFPDAYVVGAIGDTGMGLAESLVAHNPRNDRHAIELALTEGISGTNAPGRGVGLPTIVDTCRAYRGVSAIKSGTAEAIIYTHRQAHFPGGQLQGTIVGFRLPLRPGRQ